LLKTRRIRIDYLDHSQNLVFLLMLRWLVGQCSLRRHSTVAAIEAASIPARQRAGRMIGKLFQRLGVAREDRN
jgi:hypothetical protein